MGSEDIETQCQPQLVPASTPCDSAVSAGGASVPLLAHPLPMSAAPTQATTPTPVSVSTSALLPPSGLPVAASHTPPQNVTVQPSVPTVPASPLPHVQVIQQPLQSPAYLQHLYAPQQQHMFLPSNLTIQPTLQSLGGAPGLSLQLQGKTLDNKATAPTIISAAPMQSAGNFNAPSLMPAGGQMITAGTKTCVQGQMLTASTKSTAVIQGQSGFIPSTTANQTVVIGQLGVLSNQPSVLPHQAKALPDSQKSKSFLISQPATLHPKSPILPSPGASGAATGQMIANNQHLKQLNTAPHIISTQAPTMIASQAQILGSLQALGASLPQGITWATPAPLHSPALFGQNPIFIRSQQSDMFIQSPPPQATLHAVPMAATSAPQPPPTSTSQVQKLKQVRPASSVATQTAVSTSTATNTHVALTKTQGKQRSRSQPFRSSPALSTGAPQAQQMQTATTQTQTNMPPNQKADAANQTKPTHEVKVVAATQNKASSTDSAFQTPEQKTETVMTTQKMPQNVSTSCVHTSTTVTDVAVVAPSIAQPEVEQMEADEPEISPPVVEDVAPKIKATEEESVGVVAPMTEVTVKEKQPQKAIVKPHVLTHVIEGFVIQEGSEPFPVSRSSLLTNSSSPKAPLHDKPAEMAATVTPTIEIPSIPKKKEKIPKIRGPVELAKCEFCGKLGPKSKFKRSKRFCSTSCAKRYNVGCSKRLALVLPPAQEQQGNPVSGKAMKKKKIGFKSKKGWRKAQGRNPYNITGWNQSEELDVTVEEAKMSPPEIRSEESANAEAECETTDTPSGPESSVSPTMPSTHREELEGDITETNTVFLNKSALKWTVTDVVEFVRGLPGCSDYADEFRAQEIDGQALLLLKEDHLMSTMSMKLGPALKVCARINNLKDEVNH